MDKGKRRRSLGPLWIAVAAAIAGAFVTQLLIRPAPLAIMDCTPQRGPAPLTVSCTNKSHYFDKAVWIFGDSTTSIDDGMEGRITHTFDVRGDHLVVLRVTGTQVAEHRVTINVGEALPELIPNLSLDLVAIMRDQTIIEDVSTDVHQRKDDHPSSSRDSRTYRRTYQAKEGYRITGYDFIESSSNNAEHIAGNIAADGLSIDFSFNLTSGPFFDRWDGWLHGTLMLEQTRVEPGARLVVASDFQVAKAGLYALPTSVALSNLAGWEVSILGDEGETHMLRPAEVLRLSSPRVDISIESRAGKLYLMASQLES